MGRATIADIARHAGVSTATVDRVLNSRAGVRAGIRHGVFQAAKELGYLPSEGMVVLPSHPAHLEFMIPFDRNEFMHEVSTAITEFATGLPLVASCRVTELDGIGPDALIPMLENLSLQTEGVGIVTTDHPRTRAAIARLCEAGVKVVTIASDVTGTPRADYVGVRNRAAGQTAARMIGMMAGNTLGEIGLFLGSHAFHGHRERETGFRELLGSHYPHLSLLKPVETGENGERTRAAMQGLLRSVPDLRGVYCVGGGRSGIIEALEMHGGTDRPRIVIHDLTRSTRGWLERGLIDVVIDQNARLVGEQSVIRLLGSIAAGTPLLPFKEIEPRIILRENLPKMI